VNSSRRSPSRYRWRPLRTAAVLLTVAVLAYAFYVVPHRLALSISLPAASVLSVRGATEYEHAGSTLLGGRCLALRTRSDGLVLGVVAAGEGRAQLVFMSADGGSGSFNLVVPAEPGTAAFFGDRSLVVWSRDPEQGAGVLSGFRALPEDLGSRTSLSPTWTLPLEHVHVSLESSGGAVLLIGAGYNSVPDTVRLVDLTGKVIHQQQLVDGLFTSWSIAALTGGFALAGAEYVDGSMLPFIRQYEPDGALSASLVPSDGPALLLSLSPTGKYVSAVTPKYVSLWESGGAKLWSELFPGSRALKLRTFADGRTLLSTTDATLALDLTGRAYHRWRTPAPGAVAGGGPTDLAVFNVAGGCVVVNTAGVGQALAVWEGPTELVALDPSARFLARAGAGELQFMVLPGRAGP